MTTTPAGRLALEHAARRDYADAELVVELELHGRSLAVVEYPAENYRNGVARYMVDGAGRTSTAPVGDAKAVERKLRNYLELWQADAELRPQLEQLVRNAGNDETATHVEAVVGAVAYVYAMGRARRGLVVKVTASKATVAYTTASSAGRVFRKAVDRDKLVTWDKPQTAPVPAKLAAALTTSLGMLADKADDEQLETPAAELAPAERAAQLHARGRAMCARLDTAQLVHAFELSDAQLEQLDAAGTRARELAPMFTIRGWMLDELDARDSAALERYLDSDGALSLAQAYGVSA